MSEAGTAKSTRRFALKLILGAGLAGGLSSWIPKVEHAPIRPLALVIEDGIPTNLQVDQAQALLNYGYSLMTWQVSPSANLTELDRIIQAVDNWFSEVEDAVVARPTSILTWTRTNSRLLELPLKTQATILTAHASGPRFCRILCGRGRKVVNALDPPIESLIKRMRDDGREFLVQVDLGSGTRIVASENLPRGCQSNTNR